MPYIGREIMNKPKRKTAKTIIATYALTMIFLVASVASALTLNIELAAVCMLGFGVSSLACFIACVIGFIILYQKNEGLCATSWIISLVATACVPIQPDALAVNLSTLCGCAFLGCTIWGIVKLWAIGGTADA